ncbi:MAG: MBL fold metallo-hydrolase, partial [Spirochaetia bacterium]|nr:MBL fold metallo-hydrolase [Spirochaetia bacterium]
MQGRSCATNMKQGSLIDNMNISSYSSDMTTKKAIVAIIVIGILLVAGAVLAVKALDKKIGSSPEKIVTRYEDENGNAFFKITPSVANAYLLPLDEGYLMIDTGYPEDMQIVFDALSNEGIELSQIKYLFITHAHDDHAGFAAALKEKSGCRLILPERSLSDLARGTFDWQGESVNLLVDISSRIYTMVNQRTFSFEPVLPTEDDIILSKERASLPAHWDLKGFFIHTPGHSQDSWSLILQDGRAFVGDAAMNMLNLLGAGKRPIVMENRSEVYESLEKIKQTGATILFTGHGLPLRPEELPVLKEQASKGPGLGALLPYLGRLAVGIVLLVSFFLLASKTEQLIRIICYILAFILMRDLMTPFGFWTIFSDPVFGIRFAADPLLLGILAFGSLALSLTIIRTERGLPKTVPLID